MRRRPHPQSARPGLLRWLVIVFALAGLGLLQGGHCDDLTDTATAFASAAHQIDTLVAADEPVVGQSLAVGHVHRGGPAGLAPTAENCLPLVTAAAATTTAVAAPTSPVPPTSFAHHRPALPQGRVAPAVRLSAIGILRI